MGVRSQVALGPLIENAVVVGVALVTNGDDADVVLCLTCTELPWISSWC